MTADGRDKAASAYRTIGEVADDLNLPQHVLRFWETRFPQIRPRKGAGGRRYYRPADVEILRRIRKLLYDDGFTIRGARTALREKPAAAAGPAGDETDRVLSVAPASPAARAADPPPFADGALSADAPSPADACSPADGPTPFDRQSELRAVLDELRDIRRATRC